MAMYVRGTYRRTQLFYWLIIGRFTTTCFGPIPGPSLGCITILRVGYITRYLLVMGVLESSPYYCVSSWYVYFFLILYINNTSTGINCPGVSCMYHTYHILLNMYVQLFYLLIEVLFMYKMRKNTHTMITHSKRESSPKHPLPKSSM